MTYDRGRAANPLRIAQVAPPLEPVPPAGYGGTERIVSELVNELDRRGHEVTTFASGDSTVPGRLVPTVPQALRPAGLLIVVGRGPAPNEDPIISSAHHHALVESVQADLEMQGFDIVNRQDRFIDQPGDELWWLIAVRKP